MATTTTDSANFAPTNDQDHHYDTTTTKKEEDEEWGQRTALVTGSSSGIGEAIVVALARQNYKLVVTGRNEAEVKRVVRLCSEVSPSSSQPLGVVAELELEADVERLWLESSQHFGGRLDLLVNNAGIGLPVPHTNAGACFEAFKRTLQVNLLAAVQLTLLASETLKRTAIEMNKGTPSSVINIGSVAAYRPTQSLAGYGTSKAALNMYSQCMAVELGPHIRVNCINPGPVATKIIERAGFDLETFKESCSQMTPLQRIGEPEEVAQSVLFLADPKRANYISGASLTVDGAVVLTAVQWQRQ